MFQPTLVPNANHEQRRHPRVQLNLPVRLRWLGPLGPVTEVTETLDVSRGGMLIYRSEPCHVRAVVWVTFPYDAAVPVTQPETPARVARVKRMAGRGHLVGVEFESPSRTSERHAGSPQGAGHNRRDSERIPLALPIRVRPAESPWPEETMTIDFSDNGVRFCTARVYEPGELVRVSLPQSPLSSRAAPPAEVAARVVRVVCLPGAIEQHVAVALLQEKP